MFPRVRVLGKSPASVLVPPGGMVDDNVSRLAGLGQGIREDESSISCKRRARPVALADAPRAAKGETRRVRPLPSQVPT